MLAPLRSFTHALVTQPVIYDAVQRVAGSRTCYEHLRQLLPDVADRVVLDAGGGTGRSLAILNPATRYVAVDIDPSKLSRLASRRRGVAAVSADVTTLPIRSRTADVALLVFVCHHLDDRALAAALRELARVTKGHLLIMDPLWTPRRWRSRLLWRYDEGRFPRTSAALRDAIQRDFVVEREDTFAVHHRYQIWRCRPRDRRTVAIPTGN